MRILVTLMVVATLTACETVEGFGRDVSNAGDQISEEAQDAQ